MRPILAFAILALPSLAAAQDPIDPECRDGPLVIPDDYDEQVQQDFLQNYPALALTYSPVHGPVPHEPGRGAVGLDLALVPPLGCDKRFVLQYTKTEDPNVAPVAPKFRGTFAFPELGGLTFYAGAAWIPPVRVFGARTVLLSIEAGFGGAIIGSLPDLQLGLRGHATSTKVVADIARKFPGVAEDADDMYVANSRGIDLMAGWSLDAITPYVALGFTDVSTFFYIGDDGFVPDNLHPYAGITASAGIDGLVADTFRFGFEGYAAPGGYSKPVKDVESSKGAPAYGHLYTLRARLALEL